MKVAGSRKGKLCLLCLPQFFHHGKGTKFGEAIDMEAVVTYDAVGDAVAVFVRHAEQSHGVIVHAHQLVEPCCIGR